MKKLKEYFKEESGFTLVEMAIVIVIIAALLLLIIPNISKVTDNVSSTTDDAIVTTVETQAVLYELDNPTTAKPTLSALQGAGYITANQKEAYLKSNQTGKIIDE